MNLSPHDVRPLPPAEQDKSHPGRWIAVGAIAVLGVLGLLALPLALVLFWLTAQVSMRLYVFKTGPAAGEGPSWLEAHLRGPIEWDLSGCSALILVIVCFFLAYSGLSNSVGI